MYCRKCKNPIDLNKPGLVCDHCGYDNLKNPDNLPAINPNDVINDPNINHPLTCPRCGSHNIKTIGLPQLKDTPYSFINGLFGTCCFGPLGLLCGLTGSKKVDFDYEKQCQDCGSIFK